jgi:antitoxin VapB
MEMGTQLNIKSEDAYRLAAELSELTGESLTAAVTAALRERLEREQGARGREARLAEIRRIAGEIRAHMRKPLPSSNHDWMYDEDGLPR